MKQRLLIFAVVLLILGAGFMFWYQHNLTPVNATSVESIIFVINRGESIRDVASRLKKEELIRSPLAFFILVKKQGVETSIQAGDFRLRPSMSSREVLSELQHGTLDVWVTTLEGWRIEEIALKLAKELSIPESEFLKVANEGYMFPDTYLIPSQASASAVSKLMSDNFSKKIQSRYTTTAFPLGLTFDEVITLASIVEREGRTKEDRPVIAGILLNRLREGWPLQADASIQYALGYQADEKKWWKTSLLSDDKTFNSPYNTYMHVGLPPRPIANPGSSAIEAVVNPVETEYWFYLHDPSGGVHYAKTLLEHQNNIRSYLDK